MYWATTIDLNPVAFDPSAWRPHIPKADLNEQLKIYGDAPFTLSGSMMTLSVLEIVIAVSIAADGSWYVKLVSLLTPTTLKLPL